MKYFIHAKGMENNTASIPVAFIRVLLPNRTERVVTHSSLTHLSQRAGSDGNDS